MLVEIYYTEYSEINEQRSQVRIKTSLSVINSEMLSFYPQISIQYRMTSPFSSWVPPTSNHWEKNK